MLTKITSAALATSVLISGSNARRYLDQKEELGHNVLDQPTDSMVEAVEEPFSPLVQAADCPEMCMFKESDGRNFLCFKT